MTPKPSPVLTLPLLSAGLSCAAGGLQALAEGLAPGGSLLGAEVLNALDMNGAPISAQPALPLRGQVDELCGVARQRQMLAAASQDLCQRSGLSLAALAELRVFVVRPESSARQGPAQAALDENLLAQLWLDLLGLQTAHAQAMQMQGLSRHAHAFEALAAAAAYLSGGAAAGSARRALVLGCESWLGESALALLDDIDQLSAPASDGVVPGEAAVLLLLGSGEQALPLRCCHVLEAEDRWCNQRPIGTSISEMLLALQGMKTAAAGEWAALKPASMDRLVLSDAHANQEAMRRESEYLRQRHWSALAPGSDAWLDCSQLGYLGQTLFLLQLALLGEQAGPPLPACAYARSLWRHGLMAWREPARPQSQPAQSARSMSHV